MAAHFFDIDGTLVNYHTSEWLEGAQEMLFDVYNEGHDIILMTMRGKQDEGTIWSIESTEKTILEDLRKTGISYRIIFGVQSPRVIHDDMPILIDQRKTNQPYK